MSTQDHLARARDAVDGHQWATAVDEFRAADAQQGDLEADDLESFAVATWLVGREDDDAIDLMGRSHGAHLADGNPDRAVRCAFWVGMLLMERGDLARGSGWISRAERALERLPDDAVEQGYLCLPGALQALQGGRPAEALEGFQQALEFGQRGNDADLATLGLLGSGQAKVRMDDPADGLALLDEAMVAVVAEEVTPILAGIVYCAVIEACRDTLQLRRAREWTAALSEWCAGQPDLVPYRGQCLVHRAQVMQLEGRWPEALEEVKRAREQFVQGDVAVGAAWYEQAELHRLRGEVERAEQAYQQAGRHGHPPEPGLALLRLEEGKVDTAVATLRRMAGAATTRLERARVLPGLVDALLAAGSVEAAGEASDDLAGLAQRLDVPWVVAHAARARGAVLLASDDPVAASRHLREACAAWRDLQVPHELARTQLLLARACHAVGDTDTAVIEAGAARHTGQQLAAPSVVADADELLGHRDAESPTPGGLTEREVEVLVEVATGKTNRAVAEALFISDKTVARHLSNIYTKLDLSSRSAATAWAYEHDLV